MYTNTHGCTGSMIYLACPNKLIGGLLAFLSHYILDYLGETSYGSRRTIVMMELSFLIMFVLMAFLSKDTSSYFIGWTLGNMPDLIDKRLLLNMNAKQYLSCHGGNGWTFGKVKIGLFSINNWKLGYPSRIKISRNNTIFIGIMSSVALFIFTLLKLAII